MKIALTFDIERDNPNLLNTYKGLTEGLPKILKMLDHFNIKATFFCTGHVAKHRPKIIRLIERDGHEIACHGLEHERLSILSPQECKNIISKSKELLQNLCESEIYGFRAPFLDPPDFLLSLLGELGFQYDSSFKGRKRTFQFNLCILEYFPSQTSVYFRFPLVFQILRKFILQEGLVVLYFHPWEAINMKKVLFNEINSHDLIKKVLFRPDRWMYTGIRFLSNLGSFINDAIIKKANFVLLKDLINETNH